MEILKIVGLIAAGAVMAVGSAFAVKTLCSSKDVSNEETEKPACETSDEAEMDAVRRLAGLGGEVKAVVQGHIQDKIAQHRDDPELVAEMQALAKRCGIKLAKVYQNAG